MVLHLESGNKISESDDLNKEQLEAGRIILVVQIVLELKLCWWWNSSKVILK
jgi:hypothetical protein